MRSAWQRPSRIIAFRRSQRRIMSSSSSSAYLTSLFSLHGKTALITGGGTGIGAALALGLAQAGASVVLVGRREAPLQQTVDYIRERLILTQQEGEGQGRDDTKRPAEDIQKSSSLPSSLSVSVSYVAFDITDYDRLPWLVEHATSLSGGVAPTILIHNAGVNVRRPAQELTPQDWQTSTLRYVKSNHKRVFWQRCHVEFRHESLSQSFVVYCKPLTLGSNSI
jgi:hypothetical protein